MKRLSPCAQELVFVFECSPKVKIGERFGVEEKKIEEGCESKVLQH